MESAATSAFDLGQFNPASPEIRANPYPMFHLLRQAMPGVTPVGRVRPRLHDLRHTFAVRRLLAWYRDGTDIHRAIDLLCAYLGHAKVSSTYWYLTGVPELFALAAQRFERFAAPDPGDIQ